MFIHVRTDVAIPRDLHPADGADLIAAEEARALELQRKSTWAHLWRVVAQYSNISLFDVPAATNCTRSCGTCRSSPS